MLRRRVIPLVLLDGYSVVKSIRFDVRRNLGNPVVIARIYNSRNVDELVLLDIDASKENRTIDLHTVAAVSEHCFMPLTVGGGIRTIEDIEKTLKAGADKISLNTVLFENPKFYEDAARIFGSQCIISSLDIKKNESGEYVVYSHAGKGIPLGLDQAVRLVANAGVGEILLNNIDLDGEMTGYDLDLIRQVSETVKLPVIVAGGAGAPEDCVKAIQSGASAVAAASIFHFTSITPQICKETMSKAGIPVRL